MLFVVNEMENLIWVSFDFYKDLEILVINEKILKVFQIIEYLRRGTIHM